MTKQEYMYITAYIQSKKYREHVGFLEICDIQDLIRDLYFNKVTETDEAPTVSEIETIYNNPEKVLKDYKEAVK